LYKFDNVSRKLQLKTQVFANVVGKCSSNGHCSRDQQG